MMRMPLLYPLLAAGLLTLTGCDLCDLVDAGGGGRYTQDFHYSYPLAAGGRVSLEGFNGPVEISAWNDNSVAIDGTKHGPTPELRDAIKIDISATPDSVYIRALRPSERRGNFGVRFTLRVPRTARLERIVSSNGPIRCSGVEGGARLRTSNGPVRAENMKGGVEVHTSNGPVSVINVEGGVDVKTSNGPVRAEAVRGWFEAATSNGPVTVELGEMESTRAVKLDTSNGPIEIRLPEGVRGELRASTSNAGITLRLPPGANARLIASARHASVRSDFDVQGEGPASRGRLEGLIGKGGPTLDLSTSNGAIRILKQ
ncbi:MAG: DUF4097 domain-containing protein [Bryobacteraceae bacterium]